MRLSCIKQILESCIIILFIGNNLFAAFDSLVITEFMAINSEVLQDEDGDYPDWIEIYNPTPVLTC